MYEKIIANLGLSGVQAEIINSLLVAGADKASNIAKKIKRPRGVAYKGLDELMALNLVKKSEIGKKVAVYMLEHPANLEIILENKEKDFNRQKQDFLNNLPELISAYNLVSNKPGVRFYEGEEGVKKVLEDTLISNPEKRLCTFSDVASYATRLSDWNTNYYAPQRKKLRILEQVIIPDNVGALEYMKDYKANDVTDILFVDHEKYPFKTEINIYNNKVSFVTFTGDSSMGLIIDNKEIYETFFGIFKFVWTFGKTYLKNSQPEWLQAQIKKSDEIKSSLSA
jgi:sugar-specific transcriptional regulator TrmB